VYNQSGQRVRKVVEKGPNLKEEHIYLGELEIYRKYSNGILLLERETLQVQDDQNRIAILESRSGGSSTTDRAPARLIRYQLSDHLDSAALEVDENARILTYEEYSPYGSTTYQARASNLETPKRYRFTGKERDEESGFSIHGARYLAVWLGRWLTADPSGLSDGGNLYAYVRGNPVNMNDPSGHEKRGLYRTFELTIDEIWPIGSSTTPEDAFWRANSVENRQWLSQPDNNNIKDRDLYNDPKMTEATPEKGVSVSEDPMTMIDKNWVHTEETKAL